MYSITYIPTCHVIQSHDCKGRNKHYYYYYYYYYFKWLESVFQPCFVTAGANIQCTINYQGAGIVLFLLTI